MRTIAPATLTLAILGTVAGAPAVQANHPRDLRHDVARLAHQLEGSSAALAKRAEVELPRARPAYRGPSRRGHDPYDSWAHHTIGALHRLHRDAAVYHRVVERGGRGRQGAVQERRSLERLVQSFYDADAALRQGRVSSRLAREHGQTHRLMDALVERHGGYRQFRHGQPSRGGGSYDHRDDGWRDPRGGARSTRPH
jgi:hypothetical protein